MFWEYNARKERKGIIIGENFCLGSLVVIWDLLDFVDIKIHFLETYVLGIQCKEREERCKNRREFLLGTTCGDAKAWF